MNPTPTRASITWLGVSFAAILAMNTIPAVAAYFEHRWPLVSLGAAVAIWVFVAAQPRGAWADRMTAATWLLFSAYLLHGFEVDGVDLLGREFYFQTHVLETRGIELTADHAAIGPFNWLEQAVYSHHVHARENIGQQEECLAAFRDD